ncbi:hypothetical protein, partial [Kocuria marina]|uniref:hypothetical protein n=1 Tax=Kocuria marina TaxID=223184 RepID=UPI003F23BB28
HALRRKIAARGRRLQARATPSFVKSPFQDLQEVLNCLDGALAKRCGDLDTDTLPIGIAWYLSNLRDALSRAQAFHKLSGAPRYAGDKIRNAWRGLGNEIAALDESFARG